MRIRMTESSRQTVLSHCLAIVTVLTCHGFASAAHEAPSDPLTAFLFDEGTGTTIADSFSGGNAGEFRSSINPITGLPFLLPEWNTFAGNDPMLTETTQITRFNYAGNSSVAIGGPGAQGGTGGENWITLGNPANLDFNGGAGDTFTISAWVSNVLGGTFVSKAGSFGQGRQYQLWANNGANPLVHAYAGGSATFDVTPPVEENQRIVSTPDYDTYNWQHVALVVESASVAKYYVDGVLAVTFAPGTAVLPTAEVLIGARHAAFDPVPDDTAFLYDGYIDEVAFWDSALTQDNIDWLQDNSLSALAAPGQDGDFD